MIRSAKMKQIILQLNHLEIDFNLKSFFIIFISTGAIDAILFVTKEQ